jgi:transcriptional regulator with XRE-family HTH domain
MINDSLLEGTSRFFRRVERPHQLRIVWRCIVLSIARFPILVRPFTDGYVEPIRMANRSPEPLGDFISRIRNEKGLSCNEVSKQSARFGEPISASYVNRIENKRIKDPSPDRLRALAYGLGIPAEDLLARAAGLVAPGNQSEELHLVTRFRELSPDRKVVVLNIVDMFHSEQSSRRTPRPRSA